MIFIILISGIFAAMTKKPIFVESYHLLWVGVKSETCTNFTLWDDNGFSLTFTNIKNTNMMIPFIYDYDTTYYITIKGNGMISLKTAIYSIASIMFLTFISMLLVTVMLPLTICLYGILWTLVTQ